MTTRSATLIAKTAIAGLLLWLIAWELTNGEKLSTIWAAFVAQTSRAPWAWLAVALLAMPLNWLCETYKWHFLLRRFAQLPLGQAWRGVMAGVALGLFTPNRIGELGGRLWLLHEKYRWRAFMANVVSMSSQTLVVAVLGAFGLLWFTFFWLRPASFYQIGLFILTVLAVSALFFCYFNIGLLLPFLRKVPLLHKIKPLMRGAMVLRRFHTHELSTVLYWTLLRYGIYTFQYFCLLRFFGIDAGLVGSLSGIFTLFLLQTGLPLPPLMGLAARGNLAVQVWAFFGANELSSLAATFSLWIINLILPALVGTFFMFYVNTSKTYKT